MQRTFSLRDGYLINNQQPPADAESAEGGAG